MRSPITYKELLKQYTDLEDTFLLDNMRIEIQEGTATEDTVVYISKVENEDLFDSEGNLWKYIPEKTYEITDETNSFTIGYVYSEGKNLENNKNLCPDCNVYCTKRFIDGRCE